MSIPNQIPHKMIPRGLVLAQCFVFIGLYAVWALYELLYFRRMLLISGALLSIYPIYQYRAYFLSKRALPFWLLLGLFLWTIFHLFFLSQDYAEQLLELKRIWKYAGFGAVFGLGLGISLANLTEKERPPYWNLLYIGMCMPVIIYIVKYVLTTYAPSLGIVAPAPLMITFDGNSRYYVPKTDYIAFCLPVLAISLGQIIRILSSEGDALVRRCVRISIYSLLIAATLFYLACKIPKTV